MNDSSEHAEPVERAPGASAAVRRRAEAREGRGAPSFAHWEGRQPALRLADRWVEAPEPRPAPGDRLTFHPDAVRELKPKDPVRPAPNAPLLKRVVRTPYALAVVRPDRVVLIDAVPPRARQPLTRPGAAWREVHAEVGAPGPMRRHPHRPEPRLRPRAAAAPTSGEPVASFPPTDGGQP